MSAIPQNILDGQKAALENILAVQGQLFQGFEKLVDLNVNALRDSLQRAAEHSQQVVNVKDARDVVELSQSVVNPGAEKALQYGKNVYDIVSELQLNLSRLAESQLAQGQQQISDAIDQLAKNAPTGSESAVALLKSTFASATNAAETVVKAARQASDAAESNIQAAASASLKAVAQATEAHSQAVEAATAPVVDAADKVASSARRNAV